MNPTIEALILSICSMALRITHAGQYHAHIDLSAHIQTIYVRVYPAHHQYNGAGSAGPTFRADVRYGHETPNAWDKECPAQLRIDELEKLKAQLADYLPAGMEAAA